jgi:hypothetical protein
MLGKVRTTWRL